MKLKVLVFFALALCTSQISLAQETILNASALRGYTVGPGDVVAIRVLGEKDFDVDEVTVDDDGQVREVSVNESSGSEEADRFALRTVREKWQYSPAFRKGGQAWDEVFETVTLRGER